MADLVGEIDLAMSEQREGNRQALEALHEIDGTAVQLRDGSVEMNSGAYCRR